MSILVNDYVVDELERDIEQELETLYGRPSSAPPHRQNSHDQLVDRAIKLLDLHERLTRVRAAQDHDHGAGAD